MNKKTDADTYQEMEDRMMDNLFPWTHLAKGKIDENLAWFE